VVVVVVVVVDWVVGVVATVVGGAVVVVVSGDEQAATRNRAMRAGVRRSIGVERSGGWFLPGTVRRGRLDQHPSHDEPGCPVSAV
jgi:hypothetical protein